MPQLDPQASADRVPGRTVTGNRCRCAPQSNLGTHQLQCVRQSGLAQRVPTKIDCEFRQIAQPTHIDRGAATGEPQPVRDCELTNDTLPLLWFQPSQYGSLSCRLVRSVRMGAAET